MLAALSVSLRPATQPFRDTRRSRARAAPVSTRALFGGPSRQEVDVRPSPLDLKLKCERLEKDREDAIKSNVFIKNDFDREKAAHDKTKDELQMISDRLKQADKDIFKLERQLEEKQKAFDSFQLSAQRQIKALELKLKESGITLG